MTDHLQKTGIDAVDEKIIAATQAGLPLVSRPFAVVAEKLGLPVSDVKKRIEAMLENGAIRRIGVVPNHYKLGYTSNGMSVWDVDDDKIDEIGEMVGGLDYVTHCYRRPRHLPAWRYNFFAMVHGKNSDEVEKKVAAIAAILGDAARAHDVLYSTKILKKTGLRLGSQENHRCSD